MVIPTGNGRIGALFRVLRRAPWWLLLAYPVTWAALFTLSSAHWFLPAGLRVALLWLTPRRHWAWLAAAEWIGIAVVTPFALVHDGAMAAALAVVLPWLAYAIAMHEVRRYAHATLDEAAAYDVPLTVFAGLVGASLNAFILTALRWLDDGSLAAPLSMLLDFALGDYVGIVAVAPIAVLAQEYWRTRSRLDAYHGNGLVLVPVAGVFTTLWAHPLFPREYHWFLVSIPLLAVGVAVGRRAAVVAVTLLSWTYVLGAHAEARFWSAADVQRVLAVAASASILLGARRDAMHRQRARLSGFIDELQLKTQALRDAATRLSTQREAESRALGLELHDEVGQDMTALATRLRLAQRSATSDPMREELQLLQQMVTTAHDHLRSVIRHLHPIALERFGLERALCAGPLAEIADDAGIAYHCELEGPIASLRLDVATAIYRICQEAVTNAVRHGCGGELVVRLTVRANGLARDVELSVHDMAGAIRIGASSGGMGLQGIRDRANALGADYRFNVSNGQPRHWLRMTVPGGPFDDGGFDGPADEANGRGQHPRPPDAAASIALRFRRRFRPA